MQWIPSSKALAGGAAMFQLAARLTVFPSRPGFELARAEPDCGCVSSHARDFIRLSQPCQWIFAFSATSFLPLPPITYCVAFVPRFAR